MSFFIRHFAFLTSVFYILSRIFIQTYKPRRLKESTMSKKAIINLKEGICPNCGLETTEAYCEDCGQRKQGRFTFLYILKELLAVLNFDKGFLYNFYHLAFYPSQSIISYLNGKTKPFYPPLPYFLTTMTVLLFLFTFGVRNIGVTFAGKINAILDDSKTSQYIEEYEYERFKKIISDQLLTLTHQIDTVDFGLVEPSFNEHEQLKKKVNGLFVAHKAHNEALKIIKRNENFADYLSYVVFYFMPFYLAFFIFLFNKKTELFFTEHLIIQLFTMSQALWLSNLSMLLVLVVSWTYTKFSGTDSMPDLLVHTQLGAVGLAFLLGLFYLYRVQGNVYRQSWWAYTAKFILATAFTLAISYFAYHVMNIYLKDIFTNLK